MTPTPRAAVTAAVLRALGSGWRVTVARVSPELSRFGTNYLTTRLECGMIGLSGETFRETKVTRTHITNSVMTESALRMIPFPSLARQGDDHTQGAFCVWAWPGVA